MAKKFVRGITDIKEINKQDFDTNNVNDLLSDGEHNYIHRKKKDNSEEYHNLTNNLKTITSDNTDLLSVTNYNNSTNSASLHPKHDTLKEQVIESTRSTITIEHGENATTETTKVDVNPEIVLEHEKLLVGNGINKTFNNDTTTLDLQPLKVSGSFDVNTHFKGKVVGENLTNAPGNGWFVYENDYMNVQGRDYIVQTATRFKLSGVATNEKYTRTLDSQIWSAWSKQLTDETILATKQDTLQTNLSIALTSNNSLRQLYFNNYTYREENGFLNTYIKSITNCINTEGIANDEYNFIVKINKGISSISFTLNNNDTNKFSTIMSTYGANNTVRISGCVLTLNGSTLTVSTANNTEQNYVITFSHVI